MYTSAKPYFYGTGRRKSSVARVRLFAGNGAITINGRDIDDYFGLDTLKLIVRQPFGVTKTEGTFDIVCTVTGGGVSGQAGAIRHGVARALLQADPNYRAALKKRPQNEGKKEVRLEGSEKSSSVLKEIITALVGVLTQHSFYGCCFF